LYSETKGGTKVSAVATIQIQATRTLACYTKSGAFLPLNYF